MKQDIERVRIAPDLYKRMPIIRIPHKNRGYLNYLLLDTTEALISILAHEFRHLWQFETDDWDKHRRGHVWGARGMMSSRDTDAIAIRNVREWRRLQGQQQQVFQMEGYREQMMVGKVGIAVERNGIQLIRNVSQ